MKNALSLFSLLVLVEACRAFTFSPKPFSCSLSTKCGAAISRKDALMTGCSSLSFLVAATIRPSPSQAKETVEISTENVKLYFDDVRYELEDPNGGVKHIEQALDNLDWTEIKEFTKGYDLELRKKKMGFARKMMTDSKMKDEALALRNAVTFDLIAVNKAARVQDESSCREALEILKTDVSNFLTYQDKIVVP